MRLVKPPCLLVGADLEPVLDELDTRLDHRLLDAGDLVEESLGLLRRAEPHHGLDTGAVVPAAIEDHDLAGGREVLDVALDVHLRLLALGRSRKRDHAERARTHPLGDALDGAALAGGVTAFEDDADLGAGGSDPLLHRDEFALEHLEFGLVVLALHLGAGFRSRGCDVGVIGFSRLLLLALLRSALVSHLQRSFGIHSTRSRARRRPHLRMRDAPTSTIL